MIRLLVNKKKSWLTEQQQEENVNATNQQVTEEQYLKAAQYGNLSKVMEGISNGIDKEAKDDYGWTALHCASNNGHLAIVEYLLETCHVDQDVKDNVGRTAYDLALQFNESNIVQYLEKARIDSIAIKGKINESGQTLTTVNGSQIIDQLENVQQVPIPTTAYQTKLQVSDYFEAQREKEEQRTLGSKYLKAAENGDLDKVMQCINSRVDKEAKDDDGGTALHWGSQSGHLAIVQYLIETCQVHKEVKDNDGWTALHYACWKGRLEIVKYLIETSHLDQDVKDDVGRTAYDLAIQFTKRNVAQYLEKTRTDSNAIKNNMYASRQELTTLHSSQVVDQENIQQVPVPTTTYHTMSSREQEIMVKEYLDAAKNGNLSKVVECIENGIDKEANDYRGWTALRIAIGTGNLKIVQYLIETCHVDMEAKTNDGCIALHWASANGHLGIVQYLIATCHIDTGTLDKRGLTMFHYACIYGHLEIVQYLIGSCVVNAEAKDNDGMTALHCASENGHLDVVKYLIGTCHVDKEAKNKFGYTSFHYASFHGHLDMVKYLIETCRVDKDVKTTDGWTALHNASYADHVKIVKYLVETCYINTEVKDNQGRTAYDIARRNTMSNVVQYLDKSGEDSIVINLNFSDSRLALTKVNDDKFSDHVEPEEERQAAGTSSPNKNMSPDKQRQLILEYIDAAKVGSIEKVIECISQGVNVEAKNKCGITALHKACGNGHLDVVRYLVQDCHINVETKTNVGRTALHDASSNGNLDVVKYLIQTCHVNTEITDNEGWTALHFASRYGYLEIIQLLIQQCNVDVKAKNNAGETAYDLARKSDVIEYYDRAIATDAQPPKTESAKPQHAIFEGKKIQNDTTFEAAPLLAREDIAILSQIGIKEKGRGHVRQDCDQVPLTDSEKNTGTIRINDISYHSKPTLNQYELNEAWISDLMMSKQSENHELIQMLDQIGSSMQYIDERRDILDLIIVEKCNTIEEQQEQSAILASSLHRDFYLLLQRKLKCMVKSCETLSTGMVGIGGGDLRSFTARTIREKGCNVLQETRLGFFIGNAVQWAKKNLAVVPFVDTVGSIFQLVVTLKDERDRYVGLARVADFATMVCFEQYGTKSLDIAAEKFARLIVRARCGSPSCRFVEGKNEFGTFKQLMVNMLADSGNTPAKEQASKAADCAFAHLMQPDKDSVLFDVLHGGGFGVSLDEALAASILQITVDQLRNVAVFSTESQSLVASTSSMDAANGRSPALHVRSREPTTNTSQQYFENFDIEKFLSEHQRMQWDLEYLKKNQKLSKSKPISEWGRKYANVYEENKADIEFLKIALDGLRKNAIATDSRMLRHEEWIDDCEKSLEQSMEVVWQKMSRKQKKECTRQQQEKRKLWEQEKAEMIRTQTEGDEWITQRRKEEGNFCIRQDDDDDDENENMV